MDTLKIESWANKLLDVGKRNNLVNFKDNKTSTVELLFPDVETIFSKVESCSSFEIFDPGLKLDFDDSMNNQESTEDNVESNEITNEVKSIATSNKKTEYLELYSKKIRKHGMVLAYNELSPANAAIKNIDKKAKAAIEETGVNVAYMVFGFIHWKENDNSDKIYKAPILLVPISLIKESTISPYRLNITESDLVLNPTFNYIVKNEHGFEIPTYTEGSLIDYLEQIRQLVDKLGWIVTSECKLGLFSFLKLNMYEDIEKNKDQILQNDIVRVLLGEEIHGDGFTFNTSGADSNVSDISFHNVVDADSSQLEAIEMARNGKSFVLQGPPGTGKSQTITNMIAECLSVGKKVLFVSEKQAALNVVYDKLKKAGLEEFCLELHSHKANKKAVIEELIHTLYLPVRGVNSQADNEIETKLRAQKELDRYDQELHLVRDVINKSLYQLYDAHSGCRDGIELNYIINSISTKGDSYLKESLSLLEQYCDYVPSIGYQYKNNIWYGCTITDISFQNTNDVKETLQSFVQSISVLNEISSQLNTRFGLSYIDKRSALTFNSALFVMGNSDFIIPVMLNKTAFDEVLPIISRMSEVANQVKEIKTRLDSRFDQEFYDIDRKRIHNELKRLYSSLIKRIFSKDYKALINSLKVMDKSGKRLSYKDAVSFVGDLIDYYDLTEEFHSLEKQNEGAWGTAYSGVDTDWDKFLSDCKSIGKVYESGIDFGSIYTLSLEMYSSHKNEFSAIANNCTSILDSIENLFPKVQSYFDKTVFDMDGVSFKDLLKRLSPCYENIDKLRNWVAFSTLFEKLKANDLNRFIDLAIENNVAIELFKPSFQRVFYKQWIEHIINQPNSILCGFSSISHDKNVEIFKRKDKLQFDISKAQIRAELSSKKPSTDMVAQGSALQILLREGEKKRKKMSIRQLLEATGPVVQEIKPCFLMSPLSVSTFLSPKAVHFDTVIFDEASQIFPQDALGAIYRGSQLIVVGDSKQMPPTNFFSATLDSENEEEDSGDVNDFESILDICSASMSQKRLKWHYRSQFEELISFSNKNFYDGDLVTFPSTIANTEGVGIDYVYVDGVFENRRNRIEAEKVVDMVFEHAKNSPERSLGVVAFSQAQQDLIDRLIEKRRESNSLYESFFSADKPDPFFVKNLETVQGDERDTIIFSVAYGKNPEGKVAQRFGPLNNNGGERRLNVAITRARTNIKLVTSMHHTDVDIKNTESTGRRLLKEYLDYAENGNIALQRSILINQFDQFDSQFELEVCEFLRNNGFEVDTQVGVSNFRIDLGVRRPGTSDYALAVECDGATYHSSKSSRDRDRLRQEVLERMGWKFYRIWSTEWFKNTAVAKERLLEAVVNALSGEHSNDINEEFNDQDEGTEFQTNVIRKRKEFPTYLKANDTQLAKEAKSLIETIKYIADIEAPISEEWLLKRLVFITGRNKVDNSLKSEYESAMQLCDYYGIERRRGFIYKKNNTLYSLRVSETDKREFKYIALEELASGMITYIKVNRSVDKTGLFTSIAKALGYHRTTENMIERMNEALNLLPKSIVIKEDKLEITE